MVKGHFQEKAIDYEEMFAPVARLESVRIFYAVQNYFEVFQMDGKCAFLNGELEETIYVEQPPGFVNEKFPYHCYILDKEVYGLKQAPQNNGGKISRFFFQRDLATTKSPLLIIDAIKPYMLDQHLELTDQIDCHHCHTDYH